MAEELYLVIHLAQPPAGEGGGAPALPLLLSGQPQGVLEDSSLSPGLRQSIVVYHGPMGWVACDRRNEEMKSLVRDAWADLGGWRMKVIEQKEGNATSSSGSMLECSIVNNSNFLAPYLLIHDGGHAGQPPKRETLPIREGAERVLGRTRAEGRIVLDDRRVSREHLRFYVEGGAIHVENLSQYPPVMEANGEQTRIAGRVKLIHKSKIKIGGSQIEFFNPLDVMPPGQAPKTRAAAPGAAPGSPLATAADSAVPVEGVENSPGAGSTIEASTSDSAVHEGFDWVEKTLIFLAVLLVAWLVYFVFDMIG